MTRYRMDDGSIVDTDLARQMWEEVTRWDGNNHISRATGSQWDHQTLYQSRKKRYYTEYTSQWQGSRPHVEWISREEAARWILSQDHELPEDLADLESEVME
jgi:hypothetical protein